jgi:hypothetical protein
LPTTYEFEKDYYWKLGMPKTCLNGELLGQANHVRCCELIERVQGIAPTIVYRDEKYKRGIK